MPDFSISQRSSGKVMISVVSVCLSLCLFTGTSPCDICWLCHWLSTGNMEAPLSPSPTHMSTNQKGTNPQPQALWTCSNLLLLISPYMFKLVHLAFTRQPSPFPRKPSCKVDVSPLFERCSCIKCALCETFEYFVLILGL